MSHELEVSEAPRLLLLFQVLGDEVHACEFCILHVHLKA